MDHTIEGLRGVHPDGHGAPDAGGLHRGLEVVPQAILGTGHLGMGVRVVPNRHTEAPASIKG